MSDAKRISKSEAEKFKVVDKGGKKLVEQIKNSLLAACVVVSHGIAIAVALKYPQIIPVLPVVAMIAATKISEKGKQLSEQEEAQLRAQQEEQAKARRAYWAAKIKEEKEKAAKTPQNNVESKPIEEKPKPIAAKTKKQGNELERFLEEYDGGIVLTFCGIPIKNLGGRD